MPGLFPDADAPAPTPEGARFVRVAVERGIEHSRRGSRYLPAPDATLTYRIDPAAPDGPDLAVGDRVRVPLGRRDRPVEGIVVALGGRELLEGLSASARLKPVLARTGARLSPHLIDLARWLSTYYICPLGMVLASMMPAAVKRGTGARSVEVVSPASPPPSDATLAALSPAARRAWAQVASLPPSHFPVTLRALSADLDRVSPLMLRRLAHAGFLDRSTRTDIHARDHRDHADEWMPGAAIGPALTAGDGPAPLARHAPTAEQQAAIDGITATLGRFAPHLLLGVTGSGKTEVYLQLIESCVLAGRSAIVLVPEIALTPQTAARFIARLGAARVAVLHSGLTAAQRHARWVAVGASGSPVRVVVGPRSAVFAPLDRLGLIVVDEEHDSSYKQDQLPRYHARDTAIKRAQMAACPIVLGSATPSLESYANAIEGRFALWRLTRRVGGARSDGPSSPLQPPRIEIVDLALERRARAARDAGRDAHLRLIGPRLHDALDRTLADGGQAILLLNRRGFANYLCCPDHRCGWVLTCDDCDATMVMHVGNSGSRHAGSGGARAPAPFVRCHHCLAERLVPSLCPRCRRRVSTFGQGTQRVEAELERVFSHTRGLRTGHTMLRVDADTMRSPRDYAAALGRFARGEVRLLLGTQILAKGHDFPNVRLVGIVNADTSLALPDFRAAERTFQLVSQVAGRAGRRAGEHGLVIVQTFNPAEPSIVLAARGDFDAFARRELAIRAHAGLPPPSRAGGSRMARIVCRHADPAKALAAAQRVFAALQHAATEIDDSASARPPAAPPRARIRPPAPCPLSRIAGKHRIGIDLFARDAGTVQAILARARRDGALLSDDATAVDVDPVAVL